MDHCLGHHGQTSQGSDGPQTAEGPQDSQDPQVPVAVGDGQLWTQHHGYYDEEVQNVPSILGFKESYSRSNQNCDAMPQNVRNFA